MLQRILIRLVGLARGEDYVLQGSLPAGVALSELWSRAWELARGLLHIPFLGSASVPLFIGRGAVLKRRGHMRFSRGVTVSGLSLIDGFGTEGIKLGRAVTIGRGAILVCSGVLRNPGTGISIGDWSAVGARCFLGGQGGIRIGENVILGPGVMIFSENHVFEGADRPIRMQGEERAPVVIEDDCWIGAGAVITAGSHIGAGCVVGAGAVVSGSLVADSLALGVPAKRIRARTSVAE